MQSLSPAAQYTLRFINQTQKSIFLTGKAGTGKTTLLREIIQTTHKNTVVVAPTGIAALNAGGVTIHSMFQLPLGGFIPDNSASNFADNLKFETPNTIRKHFRMSGSKRKVIQSMELLIIDEVSMLRADLLDALDYMMRSVRKKPLPFGGVQLLFIGDLLQLPPVVREDEWRTLRNYYRGKFFFHSHVMQQYPPLYIELDKIFRQTDQEFIAVLNNLRNNQINQSDIEILNQYVKPNFDTKTQKGYITLTTHNNKADQINVQSLADLSAKEWVYKATVVNDFPEKIYPLEHDLKLKVGAQIMFVKNDLSFEKNYFNGKMGTIKSLSDKEIMVHFPEENKTIEVEKYEWTNIKYEVNGNTKEIDEETLGTFVHYPIKLAWAITVHKSQGLTFDKAAIDVSQVFLPGQAYVALSRLRSLQGLVLLSPIRMNGISSDQDVIDYATNKASEENLEQSLELETRTFVHQYLKNTFDWNDLAQEWRNVQFKYNADNTTDAKKEFALWAQTNAGIVWNLLDPAGKFMLQLDRLFATEPFDLQHISDRIFAAFGYFLAPMEKLVYDLLWQIQLVNRQKKMKLLYDDLMLIEELQIKAVQRMMRAKLLVTALLNKTVIAKDTLHSEEIKNYKTDKLLIIQEEFKKQNITLLLDEVNEDRYSTDKKTKEPKKSTHLETLELWQQKKTFAEIAATRAFSITTIEGHFTKLIQNRLVEITEVLAPEKIVQLTKLFADYKEETLTPMKTQVGDDYSWEELKMFKASLNLVEIIG